MLPLWPIRSSISCARSAGPARKYSPLRSSALAERIESDPSTVSRQVAALVKDGLLERRADPVDGRASLLVPTAQGEVVLAEHHQLRVRHFSRMLSTWSEADVRSFATLFQRFTDDFENANHPWLGDQAETDRVPDGAK